MTKMFDYYGALVLEKLPNIEKSDPYCKGRFLGNLKANNVSDYWQVAGA
jgi:hypothetical protein